MKVLLELTFTVTQFAGAEADAKVCVELVSQMIGRVLSKPLEIAKRSNVVRLDGKRDVDTKLTLAEMRIAVAPPPVVPDASLQMGLTAP